MRPNQNQNVEEGLPNLLNERFGSGKTSIGDVHNSGPVEEAIVVFTREVRDKGVSKVQHDKCQAGSERFWQIASYPESRVQKQRQRSQN